MSSSIENGSVGVAATATGGGGGGGGGNGGGDRGGSHPDGGPGAALGGGVGGLAPLPLSSSPSQSPHIVPIPAVLFTTGPAPQAQPPRGAGKKAKSLARARSSSSGSLSGVAGGSSTTVVIPRDYSIARPSFPPNFAFNLIDIPAELQGKVNVDHYRFRVALANMAASVLVADIIQTVCFALAVFAILRCLYLWFMVGEVTENITLALVVCLPLGSTFYKYKRIIAELEETIAVCNIQLDGAYLSLRHSLSSFPPSLSLSTITSFFSTMELSITVVESPRKTEGELPVFGSLYSV